VNVPVSVTAVSEIPASEEIVGSTIYGNYVYILDKGPVLSVVDITDIVSPVVTGSVQLTGYYRGINTFGGVIYVYGSSGVTLISVDDPVNPGIIYNHPAGGIVTDMAFRAGYAYAALGDSGLLILDVHDPYNPAGLTYDIQAVRGVEAEGGYLYISHGTTSPNLEVYSLADPLNPAALAAYDGGPVDSYDSRGDTGTGIAGNIVTSITYDGSAGLDRLSEITLDGSAVINGIDMTGRYAVHASDIDGWGIIEVTGTGGLYDMGSVLTGDSTNKAYIKNGYVYTAGGSSGLRVYRIDTADTLLPEVAITSPVPGGSVEEGANVEVTAGVTNGDNALVTFYIDGVEAYTDNADPYTYVFRVPRDITSIGIKAVAHNLNGLAAESAEVLVNVTEETEPPVLNVTSPPPGGITLIEGSSLYVTGTAVDNIGVDRVELYVNGVLFDSTLLDTFNFRYDIADDGLEGTDYVAPVLVRATDVSRNIAEAGYDLHVIEDEAPVITFITPPPDSEVYSGIMIALNVSVTDDGEVEEVRFHEDGILLGTGVLTSTDTYTLLYTAAEVTAAETRTIRAEAVDSAGQVSTIETVITIKPFQTGAIISVGDDAAVLDVRDNIAVTGGSAGRINVYNIEIPTSPVLSGYIDIGQAVRQVRIKGDKVYAATAYSMKIIDISDPSYPAELSSISVMVSYAVDAYGGRAFIGSSTSIYIYDVRNEGSPVYMIYKNIGPGTIRDIKVDGAAGLMYAVLDDISGSSFAVYDISDVNDLVETGRVAIPGGARRMQVEGDRAYIAVDSGMVTVGLGRLGSVDFGVDGDGDGTADDILSYIMTAGDTGDVEVEGDYAYLAAGAFSGIKVIDITDISAPYEVANIGALDEPAELDISGVYAYVADGGGGLKVVELYTAGKYPELEVDLVSMDVDPVAATVSVVGAAGAVTDDVYPVIVRVERYMTTDVYETQVVEADNGAFAITLPWVPGDGLYISLVETTPYPFTFGPVYLGPVPAGEIAGSKAVSGYAQVVDVSGGLAVTGTKEGGVTVFDIIDPVNPVELGFLDLPYEIRDLNIRGDRVYVSTAYSMAIIDITDPSYPAELSSISAMISYAADVYGALAFIGSSSSINIYDVSGSPVYISYKSIGPGTVRDIKVEGAAGLMYAVLDNGSSSSFAVYDISDVGGLTETGRVVIPGSARRMQVEGDRAYIAVDSGMVTVGLGRLGTTDFGTDGDGDGTADDILSYITTTGDTGDVKVKGDYAYLAAGAFSGIKVIDITDISAPYEVAEIGAPGEAIDIEISGTYAYLTDGGTGMVVIELYTEY
jgi:hypothetical protein